MGRTAGMPLTTKLKIWVGCYVVGFIFAIITLVGFLRKIVTKGWRGFFYMKPRPVPPPCLEDPSLGTHGYLHLKDVRLHYVSSGEEDKPLMLMVHGFPEFWYSWRHQLREFKDKYRVVAIDQRGYGDSDKPSAVSQYTLDILSDDLRQVVTALGYETCTLVALDWGAIIAWGFVTSHPEMVDRFVIMNSALPPAYIRLVGSSFEQVKKSWYVSFFQMPWVPELYFAAEDLNGLDRVFLGAGIGVKSGNMTPDDMEAYKYTLQRNGFTSPLKYYRALVRYPDAFYHRLASLDLKVSCPTLILWGRNSEALSPDLAQMTLESLTGDTTLKYIEDCGHYVPMDRYKEANQYMREFLDRTDKKSM